MPSGVMAQNIALSIHSEKKEGETDTDEYSTEFICHHSSHLLLHEEEAYDALLGMKAIIISTKEKVADNGICIPPMKFDDVERAISFMKCGSDGTRRVVALIIELPHRELGGKLTEWHDIEKMAKLCKLHSIKFHCDGARIFEASAGYG